jgi:prevent-host-death family protein
MRRMSVREARRRFKHVLDSAEAGEETVISRHGEEVARVVPPAREPKRLPTLADFRDAIVLEGEPVSAAVARERDEAQ